MAGNEPKNTTVVRATRHPLQSPPALQVATPQEYSQYRHWLKNMRKIEASMETGVFYTWSAERREEVRVTYARCTQLCIDFVEAFCQDEDGNPCPVRYVTWADKRAFDEAVRLDALGPGEDGGTGSVSSSEPKQQGKQVLVQDASPVDEVEATQSHGRSKEFLSKKRKFSHIST